MKIKNKIITLLCCSLIACSFTACYNAENEPLQWNSEDRVLNPGD